MFPRSFAALAAARNRATFSCGVSPGGAPFCVDGGIEEVADCEGNVEEKDGAETRFDVLDVKAWGDVEVKRVKWSEDGIVARRGR